LKIFENLPGVHVGVGDSFCSLILIMVFIMPMIMMLV